MKMNTFGDVHNPKLMTPKKAGDCPESATACTKHLLAVRDALDILNGKWKIPIIIALSFGNKRFKVVQREVAGITAKMLSKELKELEINQLVSRTVYDTSPVSVEYGITPYGRTLKKVISELHNWGSLHRKRITSGNK